MTRTSMLSGHLPTSISPARPREPGEHRYSKIQLPSYSSQDVLNVAQTVCELHMRISGCLIANSTVSLRFSSLFTYHLIVLRIIRVAHHTGIDIASMASYSHRV